MNYFEEVKKLCPLDKWVNVHSEVTFIGARIVENIMFVSEYKSFYVDSKKSSDIAKGSPSYGSNSYWETLYNALVKTTAKEPKVTHVKCTRKTSSFNLGEIYRLDEKDRPFGDSGSRSSLKWNDPRRHKDLEFSLFEAFDKPSSLVGRYIKCLDDKCVTHYGGLKTGDYLLYNESMSSNSLSYWGNSDTKKPHYISGRDISKIDYFELMSEGFTPPVEEQIKIVNGTSIKVGYYLTCWIKSNTNIRFIVKVTDLCFEDPIRVIGNYITSMQPYSVTNWGYYKNEKCALVCDSDGRTFRRSTQDEINHLDPCIEAGKYVEFVQDNSSKKEESVVGRWLLALEDRPEMAGRVKKGEYHQIIDIDEVGRWVIHLSKYSFTPESEKHGMRLMPEGFVPPTENSSVEKTKELQPQEEFPLTVKDLVSGKWYTENRWGNDSCARFTKLTNGGDFEYDLSYYGSCYKECSGHWAIYGDSKFKEVSDPSPNKELSKKPYWKKVKCIRSASISYTKGNIYDVTDDGYVIDNSGGKRFTHLTGANTFTGDTDFRGNSDFEEYIEPVVEQEPYLKKGDWVIGWHHNDSNYKYDNRPWQVNEIKNGYVHPLFNNTGHNTGVSDINRLSQQEVLDWVDKEYPEGCNYMDADINPYGTPKEREHAPRFYKGVNKIEIGFGYVYYEGKWAEKVEDVKVEKTETMLVFGKYPIGSYVVSLVDRDFHRKMGDVFKVLDHSDANHLYYRHATNSSVSSEWREATTQEVTEYKKRGRNYNISELKSNIEYTYLGDIEALERVNRKDVKKGELFVISSVQTIDTSFIVGDIVRCDQDNNVCPCIIVLRTGSRSAAGISQLRKLPTTGVSIVAGESLMGYPVHSSNAYKVPVSALEPKLKETKLSVIPTHKIRVSKIKY